MKAFARAFVVLAAACLCGVAIYQIASDGDEQNHAVHTQPKPPLARRVTDEAGILDSGQEATLSQRLARFEQATGHQMVIVTVNSLNGQTIADYTRQLGNRWGVGRADHDDGVVLLIAPNEQKLRIAVGYGLERTLTDTRCQEIIDDHIVPHIRNGDFPRGIEAGAIAIIDQLS